MSRRLSLLLALALVLGLLAGCGQNTPEPSMAGEGAFGAEADSAAPVPSQEAQPQPSVRASGTAGTFSMPYNSSYGWNPYSCIGMENRAVMNLIYEGLFTLNNSFDAEPMLCKEYSVTDDGYVYTLTLQNASFSSGKALTADDVVYSITQAKNSSLYSGRLIDVGSYYGDSEGHVIIEMLRPNDRLPCLLTFPIVPSLANLESSPPGTGPFVRSAPEVLTVNQDWWQGAKSLQFQSVTLYSSSSAEDTRDSFETDTIHLVYNNPNSSTAATFHSNFELWNSRGTTMQYLTFNGTEGMFQDKAARVAVSHAIDRVGIAESVYHNFADAAVLPASPYSSVYDEDLAQKYGYTSVKAATDELAATQYFVLPKAGQSPSPSPSPSPEEENEPDEETETEDGEAAASPSPSGAPHYNAITMVVRSGNLRRTAAAKAVAENLNEVGFYVTVKELPSDEDEFFYSLHVDEWDILYGEVTLQPDFDLRPLLASGGSLAFGGLAGSGDLDYLLSKARENSGNCYDLFEYIMDNGYLCPVLFLNNAVYTTRGVFTGLNPSPDCVFYQANNIQVHYE